mgnify:CR=1 FL=1
MTEPPRPSFARRARRKVVRGAVALVVLYAMLVAAALFVEQWLVYPGYAFGGPQRPPPDPRIQELTLTAADGTALHAWWLPPADAAAGAFLECHGNGGSVASRGRAALDLGKTTGAGVLLFDYPGFGKSTGKPTEAGCYAAADAAYAWLTGEGKVPAAKVVLLGESLGSGVAVEMATRHDHRALVLMCPFTSLPAAAKNRFPFLPTHTLMRNRFDSLSKIARCPRPLFVAHGTADSTVPYRQGEVLFAAANEPKEFLRLEGHKHNLCCDEFYAPLAAFLARHP